MSRSFERALIKLPGAPNQSGYQVTCSKCGTIEKISGGNQFLKIPPELIAAKFRDKGWSVASHGAKDICPSCQERAKRPKNEDKEGNVVSINKPPVAVAAEAPRVMSKEDGRVIFAKISDVYLDESKGYSAGWTDKRVAEDLGVPSAWVREVREQWFGKEGMNEEALLLIAKGNDLIAQMENTSKSLSSRADALLAGAAELRGQLDKMFKSFK